MKITKPSLIIFVAMSMLFLSACTTSGFSLQAPEAALLSAQTATTAQSINPQTTGGIGDLQAAYEAVYQNVNPSVVTILISSSVSGNGGLNGPGGGSGQNGQVVPVAEGSGFVWDSAGHIVTNNHVVSGASKITVTFSDGSSYEAKLVGTDPDSDLAVIQVANAPASLLKPITVGDSTQVKVGQMVVAIGNPYGLSNTMTTGIVSAINRSIPANVESSLGSSAPSFSIPDIIQTDAAINPGNSGGVLVDMNSALIGVPSQIESQSGSNSGIGFAIPSAAVSKIVPQLISGGKVQHSYLGISGATLTADTASQLQLNAGQKGVLVASVAAGGPAANAGLQAATVDANGNPTSAGDVITAIDGKPLASMDDLISYLANNTQPGQAVTLTVLRNGQQVQVKVTLQDRPASTTSITPSLPNQGQGNGGTNPFDFGNGGTNPFGNLPGFGQGNQGQQGNQGSQGQQQNSNRARLGISAIDLTPEIAQAMNLPQNTQGVLIEQVQTGSGAANAGLLAGSQNYTLSSGGSIVVGGDVITAVDNTPVTSVNNLVSLLSQYNPGQTVSVSILRNGQAQQVQVTLGGTN
jgi:S1-C subfamily serine protease